MYDVRQADGSPLPGWMWFDQHQITLEGVTPREQDMADPKILQLALFPSDQQGYSAAALPFDVVVAAHELSVANESLPTLNITANTAFRLDLTSPNDFAGIVVDGNPIQPVNITQLDLDTSGLSWLAYDVSSRCLSGQPPSDLQADSPPVISVTLSTNFGQTLHTTMRLAIVPSYFTAAELDRIIAGPGMRLMNEKASCLIEAHRSSRGL